MNAMNKPIAFLSSLAALLLLLLLQAAHAGQWERVDSEWKEGQKGNNIAGWWVNDKSHHGSGGLWEIKKDNTEGNEGIALSAMTNKGEGGQLFLDDKYKDFEIAFDCWPQWGNDAGLYLRSGDDAAWQVVIDYYGNHSLGGIYGEACGGWSPGQKNFTLSSETKICSNKYIDPKDWTKVWDDDGWNRFHVGVKGRPVQIKVWINGTLVNDFKASSNNSKLKDDGWVGFQIHGGTSRWTGGENLYRKVNFKLLASGESISGPPDDGQTEVLKPFARTARTYAAKASAQHNIRYDIAGRLLPNSGRSPVMLSLSKHNLTVKLALRQAQGERGTR